MPPLAAVRPQRPVLEKLPEGNTSEALRLQTINVTRLMGSIELWEKYDEIRNEYYQTVIRIIQR
ncbi:hypothetical protein [Parasphaerochaeta coccoides]|uniref:hypothetical protein n=1 Tax=Parasphaerochaeta coccoides TaxID=273376 RepID=UPI0002D787A9|nr:hypothetical protein [Parasphaerochaeta coccoides]